MKDEFLVFLMWPFIWGGGGGGLESSRKEDKNLRLGGGGGRVGREGHLEVSDPVFCGTGSKMYPD